MSSSRRTGPRPWPATSATWPRRGWCRPSVEVLRPCAWLSNSASQASAPWPGPVALFILDKYATDPDFREILRSLGGAIIPPIAQADTGPEALAVLQSKD